MCIRDRIDGGDLQGFHVVITVFIHGFDLDIGSSEQGIVGVVQKDDVFLRQFVALTVDLSLIHILTTVMP